ncbi:MAG: polysaccharide biosynthesis protein, partial [Thermoanaerobaculia bacterium]|nr:polysaccharide biosynthesis protein [Thermoanaerobaculia bacterium]
MPKLEPLSEAPEETERFWTRHLRREIQFLLDLGVLGGAFALAYLLRFDFSIPAQELRHGLTQWPFVVLVQFSALVIGGVYSFIWRYIGMAEVMTFVRAALYSAVPMLVMRFVLPDALKAWRIPISVTLMGTVLAFGGVLALRVLRRGVYERYERHHRSSERAETRANGKRHRVLFVGAGQAGLMAVREIVGQSRTDLEVIGFVDDDPRKKGSVIYGTKVLGSTDELEKLVADHKVDRAVITMAHAPREVLSGLLATFRRLGVSVQIMPALYEILEGRVNVSRFREVQIEDLLGRDAVKLDEREIRTFLTGSTVMVTGAGGSIGSELARQLARFSPGRLVLVERAEGALFEIDRELRALWPELEIRAVVTDITDDDSVRAMLALHSPQVILHAAAHKHVSLMEQNPVEAIRNNSLGSYRLGQLAGEAGVETFVMISTDKAVRPTSVMGASKRLAEILLQGLEGKYPTRFSTVRFGNVLGSSGSVIPIFREQIQHGGPVTVTDPEMVRYFMTIPEASQLVLQAAAMGSGGEIFLLDMGEPVRIVDLAREMIRLAGFEPDKDIEIVFTGRRPGEKLVEELNYRSE